MKVVDKAEMGRVVLMHGPSFDGSGEIVERDVHQRDVPAYVASGYVQGPNPVKKFEEAVEAVIAKPKVYSEADAIAHNDGVDVTKKKGKK